MSGRNPYIEDTEVRLPSSEYTITFVDEQEREHVVKVDPAALPYNDHGEPGSLLEIALGHGIEIDHACGGVCGCATCHVIVKEGLETCNEPSENEEDQLDAAYGLTDRSRLSCQCIPDGTRNLLVVIPSWNRNLAREGHS